MKKKVDNDDWIEIILKLCGNECNLKCIYCYEKQREYKKKEIIQRDDIMRLLKLVENKNVSFQLHGGEPLLFGKKNMAFLLDALYHRKGKTQVGIQTNGILLDKEWLDLFVTYFPKVDIGISCDGDFSLNRLRVNNIATWQKVVESIELCERYKKSVGIICVVHRECLGKEKEMLRFFKQYKNIVLVNFTPLYDLKVKENVLNDDIFVTASEYTNFLKNIFQCWLNEKIYRNYFIEPLFSALNKIRDEKALLCHYSELKCGHIFTLFPGGKLTSCDELPQGGIVYGNIHHMSKFPECCDENCNSLVWEGIKKLDEKCNGCSKAKYCSGGCLGTRLNLVNRVQDDKEYCSASVDFFEFLGEKVNVR